MASDSFTILIDAAGEFVLEGRAAARRLSTRAGRYRLVPSSENLVVLQRVDRDDDPARARVVIAGDVERAAGQRSMLADVVRFIHANGWSGHLVVLDEHLRKTLAFQGGELAGATSNQPEDRIGAVLYRAGRITSDDLERVLAHRPEGTPRFGQRLVEAGALTAHDLYRYVHVQVEEIFHSVLQLRRGEYYFQRAPDDSGDDAPAPVRLSTKQLLLDGLRRIDELDSFRREIPGPDAILVRRHPEPDVKPAARESRVLALVDGIRDVAAIARHSHLGEFEATKALFQLVHLGFVQLAPRPSPAQQPPSRESLALLVAVCNEGHARIHQAVAAHGRQEQLFQWLDSFFESAGEYAPL